MSAYYPHRVFNGQEGFPSRDDMGPEVLSSDIDEIIKMFNPTSVHGDADGTRGGISPENLNFELLAKIIGFAGVEGLDASTVQAAIAAVFGKLNDHKNDLNNPHAVTSERVASALFGDVETGLSQLSQGIAAEILNRIKAVSSESVARAAGDAELSAAVAAETVARGMGDTALAAAVSSEARAREDADFALAATDAFLSEKTDGLHNDIGTLTARIFGDATWERMRTKYSSWEDLLDKNDSWLDVLLGGAEEATDCDCDIDGGPFRPF
jgi:hypothetical protein